jgi:threonine/homoserine/homoserine lactone efflux protein
MFDPIQFVLYIVAALLLAVTPGPGIFYVAARALAGGRGEGVSSSLGTGLGGMVHVVAGSLGVSAIVLTSAELFSALKLVGAAYLIVLGIRVFWAARKDAEFGATTQSIGTRRAFREGVLVEALNPKTAAFFLAFIPQFVDLNASHVAIQFILLGAVSVFLNTLADIVVVFAASGIRSGVAERPALIQRLREASGAAMVMLGLGLALAKRPS